MTLAQMDPGLAWVDDPPPIARGDEFYLSAWRQLSTCRQLGMGIGPIPYREIRQYGQEYGLTGALLDDFVQIELALDAAYLKREAEKYAAARSAAATGNTPAPAPSATTVRPRRKR